MLCVSRQFEVEADGAVDGRGRSMCIDSRSRFLISEAQHPQTRDRAALDMPRGGGYCGVWRASNASLSAGRSM